MNLVHMLEYRRKRTEGDWMGNRVLMVATVPSMIGQFNMSNIHILLEMGYKVDVAADFTDISIWPVERIRKFKSQMKELDVECIQLDFSRNPLKLRKHLKSYNEIIKLIEKRKYSFIHTHTPIASAIVRQAAHKTGTKVIYTAHGFHFYDGAPLKNWLIFYPIEKHFSRYTDVLITINKEDYKRASEKFHAKKTEYIPGVGIDIDKFASRQSQRYKIRTELKVPEGRVLLLSVGELNENKNHSVVIKALSGMSNITYVVVGKGDKAEELKLLAENFGVDLRLTGYRNDVVDIYNAADVYVLPSIREGLNVSLMEAMASGLAVACGRIRGNTDLIEDDECLFNPLETEEVKKVIVLTVENRKKLGQRNLEKIREFDLSIVKKSTVEIYSRV